MKRKTTLRDVAEVANVSIMTVSNVINGKFGGMTRDTQDRVMKAIEALGYRADMSARGLRKGKRFSLGMLIVDRSPRFLADPWITHLIAGASNYLRECDYGLLLQGSDGSDVGQISMIRHSSTDGMLVLLSGSVELRRETLALLRETRQPLIVFQEPLSQPLEDVCILRQDDRSGARELGRLVMDGHPRRVVMLVADQEWPAMVERERGIRDAIAEADLDVEFEPIRCREDDFTSIIKTFADNVRANGVPDATIGGNDQLAFAAMRHLQDLGVRIPEEVVVTGFNGFEFARHTEPALTTVTSPAYELGALGAAALLNRLETGTFDNKEIITPVQVQVGGTTRS